MTYKDLENKISYLSDADKKLIKRAYEFAQKAHAKQKRYTGEPFICHGLETASYIADLKLDAETVAASLLHDVCEDTDCDLNSVRKNFGKKIALLVDGVTKLGHIRIRRKWLFLKDESKLPEFDRQVETLRKMFMAMARDIRIVLIKLADRLHNIKTLEGVPAQNRYRIAKETIEIYAPLADRLGMGELKGQLEDYAFPYVWPDEYQALKKKVAHILLQKQKQVSIHKRILLKKLGKAGIRAEIHGRTKHIYSLWQKLKRFDNDLSQIYDLVALRIIVSDVSECYKVLGIIHEMWRPLVGRIKDYIAMPKPNGYQSIHTTVFAVNGELIEIQIRTQKMHDHAENGIAAHWHYAEKKGTLDFIKNKFINMPSKQLKWVKELSRWQKNISNNKEMLDSLELDFFSDRIFVYTPTGDVKELPVGSTIIDFAYSIHSDIVKYMTGAKINGKMVKITTVLHNGDIVEIIKGKKISGPKHDWLDVVKTSMARNKIRHWLRNSKQPQTNA